MPRVLARENLLCPAKINLILRVGPVRNDGYHSIATWISPLEWGDLMDVRLRESKTCRIKLRCPGLESLSVEKNLAYRAAVSFARIFRREFDLEIHLKKKTPAQAGLGGGSSDAAQILKLLYGYFFGKSKAAHKKLVQLAARLGADIPVFLFEGSQWCTGIGEKCKRLPSPVWDVVVVYGAKGVPTPWAFRKIDQERRISSRNSWSESIPDWAKDSASYRIPDLENDFEEVVTRLSPRLLDLKTKLAEAGATAVQMSGSGSAFFGLFDSPQTAARASRILVHEGYEAIHTRNQS